MWHGYYGGGWPMFAGMILFWGSIIALVAWAIHRLTSRHDAKPQHGHQKNPLDILKERYARGEINKQEFEEIKRDLAS